MEAAEALLSEDRPILYPSCFHSQQAAEKYIKAFLTWHQIEFPKTHVFGGLLDLIGNVNTNLATKLADAASLNPYGVDIRYPSDILEPSFEEAKEALNIALKVRNAVMNEMKEFFTNE